MPLKTTFLLLFWLIGVRISAQINESDTLFFQYNTALSGNLQTGNLEAFALRLKADFSYAPTRHWAFKTQNAYRYQEFFKFKVDNDFNSRNFFYLGQQRRVYPFAMAFVATNFRRKIDFRHFTGAGVTWQIVRAPGHSVKMALSGVYESTRFADNEFNYPEYDGANRIETWRASAWLFGKHLLWSRRLRIYYEIFVQPSLQNADNFRWQAETGIEWPLWKGLGLTANYVFTRENVTVRTVKAKDGLLTFGIVYNGKINQKEIK